MIRTDYRGSRLLMAVSLVWLGSLALVGCAAVPASAAAPQATPPSTPGVTPPPRPAAVSAHPLRKVTDAIMVDVAHGKLAAAFQLIGKYAATPASETEKQYKATVATRKTSQFAKDYGKTLGVEFVGQRELAGDVVRLTYIERTQRRPLIWTFYGYRTAVGWAIHSWSWDDNVPALFRRSGQR